MERHQRAVVSHDVGQPVLAGHGADGGQDADHVVLAHLHRDVLAHGHLVTRAARVEQISGAEYQNDVDNNITMSPHLRDWLSACQACRE